MGLLLRLFHRCGENLEYIEGSRFPETGTTGRGKVWKNYTSCGNKLHRIKFPDAKPIKINIGGSY